MIRNFWISTRIFVYLKNKQIKRTSNGNFPKTVQVHYLPMNEIVQHINIKNIGKRLAYANTPAYVYKHLREEQSITDIADMFTSDELIAQLKNSITREVSSNEEIVLMYALLIAITLKGDEQSLNFLRHIRENSTVRWFKEITSIFLSTFKSINLSEHIIPSQNKHSELVFY